MAMRLLLEPLWDRQTGQMSPTHAHHFQSEVGRCRSNPLPEGRTRLSGHGVGAGYLWQKSSNAIMVASEPRPLLALPTGTDQ